MKKKVVKSVPMAKGRGDKFLVKLECGHKRYTKNKNAKLLVCEHCSDE